MRSRLVTIAASCLVLAACFEEPILEHLHLRILVGEAMVLGATVEMTDPEAAKDNRALAERLENRRMSIDQGWDPWSRRFARLEAAAERTTLNRRGGATTRMQWMSLTTRSREVVLFCEDVGLTPTLLSDDRTRSLILTPSAGTRATSRQRDQVDGLLAEWSEAVAEYISAAGDLYRYLELRPNRALAAFQILFESEDAGDEKSFSAEEKQLLTRVDEAVGEVAGVLLVDGETGFSLNELARLAYDPCPLSVSVEVPGKIAEIEALQTIDSGIVERTTVDPWHALLALRGRWLEPDLVTAMVAPAAKENQPEPDPGDFASANRWAAPAPTAGEVEAIILQNLIPPDRHLVTWRRAATGTDSGEIDSDAELDAAAAVMERILGRRSVRAE